MSFAALLHPKNQRCRASYSNPWATQLPTKYANIYPSCQTQLILPLIAGGVDVLDMDVAFRLGREGPAVGLAGSSPLCSTSASIKKKKIVSDE